jgi:integrase/recombinase XerD
MKEYSNYLQSKGAAKNTIRGRKSAAIHFTNWLELQEMKIQKVNYDQMMEYVTYCKENGNSIHTIRLKIKSLEYYFDYLKIPQNPAKLVQLKGGTKKIPYRLLTDLELKEIYNHQTDYGLAQKRNKVLLSLVVFQAVGSSELGRIELNDVDLMNGTIYIPGARTTNARTLELKSQQLLLFQDYITSTRKTILKESKSYKNSLSKQSDYFLVHTGSGNNTIMNNVISDLLKRIRPNYPKLKSLQQIRQSVISEWLIKYGLRKTQYLAGHRYVSSTERYKIDELEGLKKELKTHYIID